jgi:hypothetical protein
MAGPIRPVGSTPSADPSGEDVMVIGGKTPAGLVAGLAVAASGALLVGASGVSASASFTPAAAAYGALDIMDVAKEFVFTFADGAAIPAGSLIRITATTTKIDITDIPATQTSYTLHLYSVTPPSAQADNAAWTLASADLPSYLGSIDLGSPADLGAALYIRTGALTADLKLAGTSVFGRLVTVGAHTAAAVARQITLIGTRV